MATDPWAAWREWAQRAAAGFVPAAPSGTNPLTMPWAAAFERFAAEAKSYVEQASQAGAAADAARRFGDHLREQFERALPLWSAFAAPAGLEGGAGPGGAAAPALGATREHQQRSERLLDALRRAQDAQQRLQRLWSDALREAALAFSTKLTAETRALTPEGLRALYDAWIECAEQSYAHIAHGAEFARALADLVNATSDWRAEMQASFELWAKMLDLPTRSELNSLNARIAALEALLKGREAAAKSRGAPSSPQRAPRRKTKR